MLPKQLVFDGIYLPVFLLFFAVTSLVYLVLRRLLLYVHAYRLFWHPALAGASFFIIILALLMLGFGL